nr:hypothetical protein [Acidithiobacillus ferrooxidans]
MLDLDLLSYGNTHSTDPELTLPHPRCMRGPSCLSLLPSLIRNWSFPAAGASPATCPQWPVNP